MADASSSPALRAELESKAAHIIAEAYRLARQAHRDTISAEDIAIAVSVLTGKPNQLASPPTDVKLLMSTTAARPLPATSLLLPSSSTNGVAAGPGRPAGLGVGASGDSREAAAVLAALTASINGVASDSEGAVAGVHGGVSVLLAQLEARDAGQLRHVLPALTASLRSAMEACLVESGGPGGVSFNSTGISAPGLGRYARCQKILELVAAIAANKGLPAEAVAGELLALVASLLLHKLPWAPVPGASASAAADGAGAGVGASVPASKRARTQADNAASLRAQVESAIAQEIQLREYAAQVFGAVASRAAGVWPAVLGQAADMLLDQLYDSIAEEAFTAAAEQGKSGASSARGRGGASSSSSSVASETVPIACWEGAFGAAAGLACVDVLSTQQQELVRPWPKLLMEPLGLYVEKTKASIASGELASTSGSAGLWAASWAPFVSFALDRVLAKHGLA